jgi:hypothetical protein
MLTVKRVVFDLVLVVVGLTLLAGSNLAGLNGLFLMFIGSAVSALMLYDLYAEITGFKLTSMLKVFSRFRKDNCAIAWVWGVAFLAILFCPFIYWVIGWPFDIVAEYIFGLYTFTGTMAVAWDAVRFLISYLLAFCLLASVVWALVNARSQRQ